MSGTLYIVSTPIGNLEDITHRALRVLREVDLIACEDTRHTRKLLSHYGISTPTTSYHDHNEREKAAELLRSLQEGSNIAVVSDAGTPGINDPGFRIVKLASENGVSVVPVPGAAALISALVVSGFPTDEFFFGGFLPARSTQRRARLAELAGVPGTLIFYEAPHRIADSLRDAREMLGERDAMIGRELTKLHEEIVHGRLSELAERFSSGPEPRGEMVLIIDRQVIETDAGEKNPAALSELVAELESQGIDPRSALKQAAKQLGLSRDEAYRQLVAEKARQRSL
jgi:16S rRNA (cytidine1402-2'-O)-methyltransferase